MARRWLVVGSLSAVLGLVMVVSPVATPTPSQPPTTESRVALAAQAVGGGWRADTNVEADIVGVKWSGDPNARFTVSTRDAHGNWSAPTPLDTVDTGPDPGTAEAAHAATKATEPVWVRGSTGVRVQLASGAATHVDLHTVDVPNPTHPSSSADAAVAYPGIITRAQWGADESLRFRNCNGAPQYSDRLRFAVVHHTADGNTYSPSDSFSIVRGIYAYSVVTLGYCDMMYNFLVDKYGQIFEGRYGGVDKPVLGAHAIGFNTESVGIAMIGNYMTTQPSAVAVDAVERLIAWKFAVSQVDPRAPVAYRTAGNDKFAAGTVVTIPTIVGHRDTWFTACPGDALYALLPAIRASVTSRVGGSPPVFPAWVPQSGAPRLLTLDSWGGLYPAGGQPAVAPSGYWPNWGIARGVAELPGGTGGYVLDGFGGLHTYGSAPALRTTGYWPGWDIARDVVLLPGGTGGYVLDGWGALHPFGNARPMAVSGYWPGWDIARRVALLPSGTGGYVLDGWGGLHAFGTAPAVATRGYWPGWNIARDVAVRPGTNFVYVLDGLGGVWPATGAPSATGAPYYGRDTARSLVMTSAGGGYTLRNDGGINAFGGAPAVQQAQALLSPPNGVTFATG